MQTGVFHVNGEGLMDHLITGIVAGLFGTLAMELSADTGSGAMGGDLGWFGKGQMVSEFETAAFALEIGQVSEPVQSDFGWHIIQVLGRTTVPMTASQYETPCTLPSRVRNARSRPIEASPTMASTVRTSTHMPVPGLSI